MENSPNKGSGWQWWFLYFMCAIVDVVQLIIGWTGIGTIISEFLELIMPAFLFITLLLMKVSVFQYPLRLVSILGITGLDAITAGVAPFWVLDVWYLQHSVKGEDRENAAPYKPNQNQQNLIENGLRRPTPPPLPQSKSNNIKPLVNNGIRVPRG